MTTMSGGRGPVITMDYLERRFKDIERNINGLRKKFEEHEGRHVQELRDELEAALTRPRSRRLEVAALLATFGSLSAVIVAVVALATR